MSGQVTTRVPFSRRHPGAFIALWAAGVTLVVLACTAHVF
jgi:hypothetical protein